MEHFNFSAKLTLTYQNGVLSLSAQGLQSDLAFAASGTVQLQVSAKGRGRNELVRLEDLRSRTPQKRNGAHDADWSASACHNHIFGVWDTRGGV